MTRFSVNEIQSRIAAVIDQDESTTNISTADYSLRLKYINMAEKEWAEASDWDVLYTQYNTLTSTSSGNLSIAMPENFRKLASYPKITTDGATTYLFPNVDPVDDTRYGTSDKRFWLMGNPADNYVIRIFGVDALASGASINVPYFKSVGSLASPADISLIPNADFLVQRTIGRIWEAREDPRFPKAEAKADLILQNLLEFEDVKEPVSDDRISTVEESRFGFRIGEN